MPVACINTVDEKTLCGLVRESGRGRHAALERALLRAQNTEARPSGRSRLAFAMIQAKSATSRFKPCQVSEAGGDAPGAAKVPALKGTGGIRV
jgi:hypothetical protein